MRAFAEGADNARIAAAVSFIVRWKFKNNFEGVLKGRGGDWVGNKDTCIEKILVNCIHS